MQTCGGLLVAAMVSKSSTCFTVNSFEAYQSFVTVQYRCFDDVVHRSSSNL